MESEIVKKKGLILNIISIILNFLKGLTCKSKCCNSECMNSSNIEVNANCPETCDKPCCFDTISINSILSK